MRRAEAAGHERVAKRVMSDGTDPKARRTREDRHGEETCFAWKGLPTKHKNKTSCFWTQPFQLDWIWRKTPPPSPLSLSLPPSLSLSLCLCVEGGPKKLMMTGHSHPFFMVPSDMPMQTVVRCLSFHVPRCSSPPLRRTLTGSWRFPGRASLNGSKR